MNDFTIIQRGNIYFFYRPKIELHESHDLQDVQRLFMVLKPEKEENYIITVITKKVLPEDHNNGFIFVDKIVKGIDKLIEFLDKQHYQTKTKGERITEEARCLGEGKFIIASHKGHTHFSYQLTKPESVSKVQEDFHLHKIDDFIINVMNPEKSTPGYVGILHTKKPKYTKKLLEKFSGHKLIPTDTKDFLEYENAEFILSSNPRDLLIDKSSVVKECFKGIVLEDIIKSLSSNLEEVSIIPLIKRKWS